MRSKFRVAFVTAVVAGLVATGSSTALAAKSDKQADRDDVTAASEGGKGGNGGNGGLLGLNFCPAIAVLAPANASCSAANGGDANGGDAKANAKDHSTEKERSKDKEKASDSD